MKSHSELLSHLNLIKKMMAGKIRQKDVVYVRLNLVNEDISVLSNELHDVSSDIDKAMKKQSDRNLIPDIILASMDYVEFQEIRLADIRVELSKLNNKKNYIKKELISLDFKLNHLADLKKLDMHELELLHNKDMDAVALMSWLHKRNVYA